MSSQHESGSNEINSLESMEGFAPETIPTDEYEFTSDDVQEILDVIESWIFIKTRNGAHVFSNEKHANELVGMEPEELRGMTNADLMDDEEEAEKVRQDDLRILEEGEKEVIPQERITTYDDEEYILRTVKEPVDLGLTEGKAMMGVATEISGQVDSEKVSSIHESTQDLMTTESVEEIAAIAVETITNDLGLDYCTVWTSADDRDELRLRDWSQRVGACRSVPNLGSVTSRPGDTQWNRFEKQEATVETNMQTDIDPSTLPVEEPLCSLIVLPIGEYGLLEVGSFEEDIFKDDLARILASSMETAFGRLERERELERLAGEVEETVNDVDRSTDEVSTMSQDISDRADSQSETMMSVSEEVTRMSANIEEIAATANEVENISDRAANLSNEGQISAKDAKRVIDEVTHSVEQVVESVRNLESHVEEIDTILDIINDIAEQTNILALNASIEAARADESGDAFEIVASEVKELAGESQEHASEIEGLIENVQQNTDETVENLEQVVNLVDEGSERVDETMSNLEDIAEAVDEASLGISEVSAATDDQAASTEEVTSQVEQATELADDVAEQIDQIAESNERITTEVSSLKRSVSRLTADR